MENEISIKSLKSEYQILRESTPPVVISETRETKVNGCRYVITSNTINRYTTHYLDSSPKPTEIEELNETGLRLIWETRNTPHNYAAIVTQINEQADSTQITTYGATVGNHQILGGCMYDAGIPLSELTPAHNTGLEIMIPRTDKSAFVRYKFDLESRHYRSPTYFYHAWMLRPNYRKHSYALAMKQKIDDIATALDYILPEQAAIALSIPNDNYESTMMMYGHLFSRHNLGGMNKRG